MVGLSNKDIVKKTSFLLFSTCCNRYDQKRAQDSDAGERHSNMAKATAIVAQSGQEEHQKKWIDTIGVEVADEWGGDACVAHFLPNANALCRQGTMSGRRKRPLPYG